MAQRALLFGEDRSQIRAHAERGLRRLGFDIEIQVPGPWSPADSIRTADAVVVVGMRGKCAEAAEFYRGREIPVAMLDLAHLRQGAGAKQLRVTPPDHAWLPKFGGGAVPHDRLETLGIEIGDRRRVKGQYVLLVGQLAGDSAHGKTRAEFIAWAQQAITTVRSLTESSIVWRPHPVEIYPIQNVDGMSDPASESLATALEKTWLVVTYNSTAGLEALIEGLPVVCEGPSVYAHLCGALSDFKNLKAPAKDALRDLLARLAYTQWSPEEIADGLPIEVALGLRTLRGVSDAPPPRVEPPVEDVPPPAPGLTTGSEIEPPTNGAEDLIEANPGESVDPLGGTPTDAPSPIEPPLTETLPTETLPIEDHPE